MAGNDEILTIDEDHKSDPVEIVIDEKGKGAVVEAKPETDGKKPAATAIPAEEGVESLKRQMAEMQRREAESARIAREREAEAIAARTEVAESRAQTVASQIDALTRTKDAAKRDYAEALSTGDFAKAADAQDVLSATNARLINLESGKATAETQRLPVRQTEGRVIDPVEAFADRLSPASGAWVRQHPETVTNPSLNAEMVGAHNRAIRLGYAADGPEYFKFIENQLGFGDDETKIPVDKSARRTAVAAPVSRDAVSNSGRSSGPVRVTLSSAERETADALGMDYIEYAKNKLALQAEGKLTVN